MRTGLQDQENFSRRQLDSFQIPNPNIDSRLCGHGSLIDLLLQTLPPISTGSLTDIKITPHATYSSEISLAGMDYCSPHQGTVLV